MDSDFSNSQLESQVLHPGDPSGRDGTFVSAPAIGGSAVLGGTNPVRLDRVISRKLWSAIRRDAVTAFGRRYPATVTPRARG